LKQINSEVIDYLWPHKINDIRKITVLIQNNRIKACHDSNWEYIKAE